MPQEWFGKTISMCEQQKTKHGLLLLEERILDTKPRLYNMYFIATYKLGPKHFWFR